MKNDFQSVPAPRAARAEPIPKGGPIAAAHLVRGNDERRRLPRRPVSVTTSAQTRAKLSPNAGTTYSLTMIIRSGVDVVVPRQLLTVHPGAVVHRLTWPRRDPRSGRIIGSS